MESSNQKITRKTQVQMGGYCQTEHCQMKVKNWITRVQDRGKWKDVIEKAITFNH